MKLYYTFADPSSKYYDPNIFKTTGGSTPQGAFLPSTNQEETEE